LKNKSAPQVIEVLPEMLGLRLDKALSFAAGIGSRSRAENLISQNLVTVNGQIAKSSVHIKENDVIEISFPDAKSTEIKPFEMALDILFEDQDVIVINKPSGLVVHPAAGHHDDTLVNALISHTKDLAMKFGEERPGIVHRLDKETSGILVVAKNDFSLENLSAQFKARTVHRIYHAICFGIPPKKEGTVKSFIARHSTNRKKFASVQDEERKVIRDQNQEPAIGKWAVTHFKVLKIHPAGLAYVQLKLETGRTHQIRVHMSEMGYPILSDDLYATDRRIKSVEGNNNQELLKTSKRCALHACELGFQHPKTGKELFFKTPWPDHKEIREHFFKGFE